MAEILQAANNPFQSGTPSWMYGDEEFLSPQDEWQMYTAGMPEYFQYRAPMQDVGQRLQARYLLGAPQMSVAGRTPTFQQYMTEYPQHYAATNYTPALGTTADNAVIPSAPSYFAGDYATLRARAAEAARAGTVAPGTYISETEGGEAIAPETPEFDRAAWYLSQFGADAGAQAQQQNQMAVANLLALQRGTPTAQGATTHRGRRAQAIRNAMGRLYQRRAATGAPRESFLSLYLDQTT